MCMSDNSRDSDSNGSFKSLRNRLQSMQIDKTESKRGQNHLSDLTKNIGSTLQNIFSSKAESSVTSRTTARSSSPRSPTRPSSTTASPYT